MAGSSLLLLLDDIAAVLAERLAARGIEANCYSLLDVLLRGQGGEGQG